MSVDFYTLCTAALPSKSEWQMVIGRQHLPFAMDPTFDPAKDSGFWPAKIRGGTTGFEFYTLGPSEWEHMPNVGDPRRWVSGAQFSTGANITEFAVSVMAAVALAKSCGGVVYDPQESKLYRDGEMDKLVDEVNKVAGISP